MSKSQTTIGLGLRHEFLEDLRRYPKPPLDFLEIAPENWLDVGGQRGAWFREYAKQYPIFCHGLSLSLGGLPSLDKAFLDRLKTFFQQYDVAVYSEHLSYCNDEQGQLYELLPIPFTEEAVKHVAKRIRTVQDHLERRIAIENPSFYCMLSTELSELDFINAVLEEADCDLLLDVNNVYVNSQNHAYDPRQFIANLPTERIAYLHIAGHERGDDGVVIDTHGDAVINPVWDLLRSTYEQHGLQPTLLERDNDVPTLDVLFEELNQIKRIRANIT